MLTLTCLARLNLAIYKTKDTKTAMTPDHPILINICNELLKIIEEAALVVETDIPPVVVLVPLLLDPVDPVDPLEPLDPVVLLLPDVEATD